MKTPAQRKPADAIAVQPLDFFVMRRPRLNPETWLAYRAEAQTPAGQEPWARRAATALGYFERDDVGEAIFLASEGLHQRLRTASAASLSTGKGQQLLLAFERYLARMCHRSTPFGTFSSVRFGTVREAVDGFDLGQSEDSRIRRMVRLDHGVLHALAEQSVAADPQAFRYTANASIERRGDAYHYIEWRQGGPDGRVHMLSAVDAHPVVGAVLEACRQRYVAIPDLIDLVHAAHGGFSRDAVQALVVDLVEEKLLTPELWADPLADNTLDRMIATLGRTGRFRSMLDNLVSLRTRMDSIEREPGGHVASYREVSALARRMMASTAAKASLRVDSFGESAATWISTRVATDICDAIQPLMRKLAEPDASLARFCSHFKERYGESAMPLTEVLEDEALASVEERFYSSPVLAQLGLRSAAPAGSGAGSGMRKFDRLLLAKLLAAGGRDGVIEITDADLASLPDVKGHYPAQMFAIVSLLGDDAGNPDAPRYHLHGLSNREPGSWLGRFSSGDADLRSALERSADAVVSAQPDALHAEISYLPSGPLGNILCRPLLWPYRINLVQAGPVAGEFDIALNDLLVRVDGNDVQLWSRRLGKRVVPHMTTAHSVAHPGNIKAYRFLRALEQHGKNFSHFSWGGEFLAQKRLPRVIFRSAILATARWSLDPDDRRSLMRGFKADPTRGLVQLLDRLGVPRWVEMKEGDNTLLLDLTDELDLQQVWRSLKTRWAVTLTEHVTAGTAQGGSMPHELLLPFRVESAAVAPTTMVRAIPSGDGLRDLQPAALNDVLFFKVYLRSESADSFLIQVLRPLLDELRAGGLIRNWFYIRYADPDHHLRIRLFTGREHVGQAFARSLERIYASGLQLRVQLAEFERESVRYGGAGAIPVTEELFCVDSELAIRRLQAVSATDAPVPAWHGCVQDCLSFMEDTPLALHEQHRLAVDAAESFRSEFLVSSRQRDFLGALYRRTEHDSGAGASADGKALRQRRRALLRELAGLVEPLGFPRILRSHLHMTCNRLLQDNARAYEVIVYDFLERALRAQLGRAARSGPSVPENAG